MYQAFRRGLSRPLAGMEMRGPGTKSAPRAFELDGFGYQAADVVTTPVELLRPPRVGVAISPASPAARALWGRPSTLRVLRNKSSPQPIISPTDPWARTHGFGAAIMHESLFRSIARSLAILALGLSVATTPAVARGGGGGAGKGAHAVLPLERAGWHTTSKLDVPDNITPIFVCSRAPEAQPG